jgi:hypothetical protein
MPSTATSCRKTTIVEPSLQMCSIHMGAGMWPIQTVLQHGRFVGRLDRRYGQERLQLEGKDACSSRDCPLNYEGSQGLWRKAKESSVPPHRTVPDSCDDDDGRRGISDNDNCAYETGDRSVARRGSTSWKVRLAPNPGWREVAEPLILAVTAGNCGPGKGPERFLPPTAVVTGSGSGSRGKVLAGLVPGATSMWARGRAS